MLLDKYHQLLHEICSFLSEVFCLLAHSTYSLIQNALYGNEKFPIHYLAITCALIQLDLNMENFSGALHELFLQYAKEKCEYGLIQCIVASFFFFLIQFVCEVIFAKLMPYWWNYIKSYFQSFKIFSILLVHYGMLLAFW